MCFRGSIEHIILHVIAKPTLIGNICPPFHLIHRLPEAGFHRVGHHGMWRLTAWAPPSSDEAATGSLHEQEDFIMSLVYAIVNVSVMAACVSQPWISVLRKNFNVAVDGEHSRKRRSVADITNHFKSRTSDLVLEI